jgi:phospholipase/lecithinase/hemolysin
MRLPSLLLATTLLSPAQSLFHLAPDEDVRETIPRTFTASANFGYPGVSEEFAATDPDAAAHWLNNLPARNSPAPPGRNFFFGDSLTDTGNISDLIGGLGPGYPGSTLSNGPTWVTYLDPSTQSLQQAFETPTPSRRLGGAPVLSRSTDFSAALATTQLISDQQVNAAFAAFQTGLNPTSNDRAFIWGGANDFLPLLNGPIPPTTNEIEQRVTTGVANLSQSVLDLSNTGIENITIISLFNIGLSPRADGFAQQGAGIARLFNSRLKKALQSPLQNSNLTWIDTDALLNDAVANPAAYGLSNVTDAAAPQAIDGIPSTLTAEEQAEYLFYDDLHPTTGVHQQIARFVSHHLTLEKDAQALFLVTDAALFLDDRFGFENAHLQAGQTDLQVTTFITENQAGPARRQTSGLRADLDLALTDQLSLGGEFIYTDGDGSPSDFESLGLGIDLTHRTKFKSLDWETGLGTGHLWGDFTRNYNLGTFRATSSQDASVYNVHTALGNPSWSLAGLDAYWKLGLKHRFVLRSASSESGAASLDLHYSQETLSTTLANFEIGLHLTPKFDLQLALTPILFHQGGEISARQRDGLAAFSTPDLSAYDTHTARTSFIYHPTPSASLSIDFTIGSDNLWSTNLSYRLRF